MSADGFLTDTPDAGIVHLDCWKCGQPIGHTPFQAHRDCVTEDGRLYFSLEVMGAR